MRGTERRPPQRPLRTYESLARFYGADPRRITSRERDIGLWWRDAVGSPLHRAAWISDTGELYLVRLGPADVGGGVVEVLAECDREEQLESVLDGWREQCGEPRSLTWLRARARRLSQREPGPRMRVASSAAAG
jgi:hypothetical protein